MAEVKIQLVRQSPETVLIDIEPPVDDVQERLLRADPLIREIPEDALVFTPREPSMGNPFSEVNCAKVREGAESQRLELDEANFAARIAGVLTAHGDEVTFDPEIKPIERRGYLFLGLTPQSPPEDIPPSEANGD